jgi:hypothetical protein
MRRRARFAAALVMAAGFALGPITLAAQPADSARTSSIIVYTENDDWWPDTGTDKNYTNALRVTLERNHDLWRLRRLGRLFRWVPDHADCADMPVPEDDEVKCVSSAWHLVGQQFYTPDDISVADLIPGDRPYAGWLYVGGSWKASSYTTLARTDVYVGATGKASFARQVQTEWHRLVGAPRPEGWDHQIGGRLGLIVGHSRHKAFERLARDERRWLEFVPYAGATVGNILTDGYAGARLKVGYNVTRDWSQVGITERRRVAPAAANAPPNSPASPAIEATDMPEPSDFEIYVVVDGQGRALPYNVFLDAAPNHTLDRRYFVVDGGVGLGVRFRRITFSYRVAFVTPEYEQARRHDYKALRFSVALGR